MKVRVAAKAEQLGEDRGWDIRSRRDASDWHDNETRDRAWILRQLRMRVGKRPPRKCFNEKPTVGTCSDEKTP